MLTKLPYGFTNVGKSLLNKRPLSETSDSFTLPRDIIRATTNNFYDMEEETIREKTFCCGGGGGLLTDDLIELRMKGAQPRMEALKRVIEEHGVTHMAAICAICKSQFSKAFQYYGFELDQIISLHNLVGDALIMNKKEL